MDIDEIEFDLLGTAFVKKWCASQRHKEKYVGGMDLLNTIAYSVGYEIYAPSDSDDNELVNKGDFFFFGETAKQHSTKISSIMTLNLSKVRISLIPVAIYYQKKLIRYTVFKVINADQTAFYVDQESRKYKDYKDWLSNNVLPAGKIIFPLDFNIGDNMDICRLLSASASWKATFWKWADRSALAFGLTSFVFGLFVPGTQIIVLCITLGIGVYGLSRSVYRLYDRNTHSQSIGLKDQEARRLWVNMLASLGTIATCGASIAVFKLASSGATFQMIHKFLINSANYLNVAGNTLAVTNDSWYLAMNWNDPKLSGKQKFFIAVQIAFSLNCIFSFQNADQLINQARAEAVDQVVRQLPESARIKLTALRETKCDLDILNEMRQKVQELGLTDKIALNTILDNNVNVNVDGEFFLGAVQTSKLSSFVSTIGDAMITVGARKLKESLTADNFENIQHIIVSFPDIALSFVGEVIEAMSKRYESDRDVLSCLTSILGFMFNIFSFERRTRAQQQDRIGIILENESNIFVVDQDQWKAVLEKVSDISENEIYDTVQSFKSVESMVGSLKCVYEDEDGVELTDREVKRLIHISQLQFGCEAVAIYQYITEGLMSGETDIKSYMEAANSFVCQTNFARIEKRRNGRFFHYKREKPFGEAIVRESNGYLTLCSYKTKLNI